jgi:hypothetical protein
MERHPEKEAKMDSFKLIYPFQQIQRELFYSLMEAEAEDTVQEINMLQKL